MTRNSKLRNLLVYGINEAVQRKSIDLGSLKDVEGHFYFELFDKPSKFYWTGIGHGEVRVTIWWGIKSNCKDSNSTKPLNKKINAALDACCSGWLERKDGLWLQGKDGDPLLDAYCSATADEELNSIPKISGKGFNNEGKFFM